MLRIPLRALANNILNTHKPTCLKGRAPVGTFDMDPHSSLEADNLPGSFPNQESVVLERYVKSVDEPAANKPTDAEFYITDASGSLKPNHAFLKDHFFKEGRLQEEHAMFILEELCGDIHGQYYDLMKLFEIGGSLNDNCYLFLGDYVDRGCFGIECLLYLYALKLCYPTKFVLLRGNHECRHLTEYFTFKRECLHKYSERVYEACIQSFLALPVSALVDRKFFCMDRFQEPGSHGLLCDLLWADPNKPSSLVPKGSTFLHNATRGCSYFYTYTAACQFLERTHLLGIIRGHEAQDNGYTNVRKTPTKKFPSVITIFSAPNYLDVYHNRGAVIKYANKNITIRQYNASTHPYWLPNFMDAFTWSLPFVGAKITEMLLAILSICSEEELTEEDSSGEDEETRTLADAAMSPADYHQRRQQIKSKIMAVGRMQRVFQLLREESEAASELVATEDATGSSSTGVRVGPDALNVHGTQIVRNIRSFDDARRSDLMNERLPVFEAPPRTPTSAGSSSSLSIFPPPSMRSLSTSRHFSMGGDGGPLNMEMLIKKTLEEEEEGGDGIVERLADRIAMTNSRRVRPQPLKRHGTA
ncbi:Metallo-dependent phosphatase [Gymnopus androsaceus JB14]|uniref:Serine/threonine-protein phosphatase n=1 Tax=Gymnopus androsaceus JB14 TaxID=1447944 RepID=A0A6A4H7Z6_9AGAR|nr:Metallo-dependent phosphatase [Gymnopus androsaceus JB14]